MARRLILTFLFFVLFILTAHSARPFNAFVSDGLAAVDSTLNIVTASNGVGSVSKEESAKRLLPCDNMSEGLKIKTTTLRKLKGTYRTLVLNSLPKGRIPSSGPSKRTNSLIH